MDGIKEGINQLKQEVNTLILSTQSITGETLLSYAPYVEYNNKFYIVISKTAAHYKNMLHNEKVSGLIIEDESSAKNLFARRRLTYVLLPRLIENNDEITKLYPNSDFVEQLLKMDFSIFELEKIDAKVVLGFGKAYFLDENELVVSQDLGGKNKHA